MLSTPRQLREHRCSASIQHHHPPIRLTHSGAAQSAVELCTSSNGSPPRNSCFAASLATSTRPMRRMKLYRFIHILDLCSCFGAHADPLSLPAKTPWTTASPASTKGLGEPTCCSIRPFSHPTLPTQSVPDPAAPVQTDSKYIGFPEAGFLQVAVSEAPPLKPRSRALLPDGGAPDTALRLTVTDQRICGKHSWLRASAPHTFIRGRLRDSPDALNSYFTLISM